MDAPDLLRAWLQLFQTREDLRFTTPPVLSPCDTPAFFPEDARALAAEMGRLSFAYTVADQPEVQGSLFLDLSGEPAGLDWLSIDGDDVSPEDLADFYELDQDGLGTGHAGWYWVPQAGPAKIVFSIADPSVFDSLAHYLLVGARRGFVFGWQWAYPNPLAEISAPPTTPRAELKEALMSRGASPETADALLDWLGEGASLLVPRPRVKKEVAPPADTVLITYRLEDLPPELTESFAVTDDLRRCLFWATRGGEMPVIDQLFAEVPEPSIAGADVGMEVARVVQRVVAEATEAHIRVKARGSFRFGYHSGDGAVVEAWLREHGVALVPIREILPHVLVIRVEGASSPDAVLQKTRHGADYSSELYSKGAGIYAIDRSDSDAAHFVVHEVRGGRELRAELRAADVPRDHVARVTLA